MRYRVAKNPVTDRFRLEKEVVIRPPGTFIGNEIPIWKPLPHYSETNDEAFAIASLNGYLEEERRQRGWNRAVTVKTMEL